jgi:dephospho-CoA kinase
MAFEMKWIGLTGGIASGKSTVAALLRKMGIPVVDADELARAAVQKDSPGLAQVVRAFGRDVLTSEGNLDRKRLGQRVFGEPNDLKKLEDILHPIVRKLAEQEKSRLQEAGHKVAIYDVPLLFEKNMESLFNGVLVVSTTPEIQQARVIARDGLSSLEAKRRMSTQMDLSEKLARATWVIENSGSPEELEIKVKDWAQSVT